MNCDIKKELQGTSVKLTCSLVNCRSLNPGQSEQININDLASVKFYLQPIDEKTVLTKIMTKKQPTTPTDCNVKVRVTSEELNYFSEIICSTEGHLDLMGQIHSETASEGYKIRQQLFQFTVTIFACKTELTVERFYKETDLTDFCLRTVNGSGVAIQKACLAAYSNVFKKMLTEEWRDVEEGSLQLPGITLDTLQHLKKYMCLGRLSDDSLLPLLEIASYYQIHDLKEKCVYRLAWNVKPEDFHGLLQYSINSKISELTYALMQITPHDVIEKSREIVMKENSNKEPNI